MAQALKPFFSIVIPALNEEKYLPHLLADLTKQSYQDFEVIVVDGHSDDKTVAKAKEFTHKFSRLTILTSPRHHVCTQRNLGVSKARANWLVFMDADNRLPTYFLQGLKYRLESDPADLATTHFTSDSSKPLDINSAKAISYAMDLLKNTSQPRVMESLIVAHHKAFNQIGGFDESIDFDEGTSFLLSARRNNLTFRIYHDPKYLYSPRRYYTHGRVNFAARGALLEILRLIKTPRAKSLITKLYPMQGGSQFKVKDEPQLLKQISRLLDTLKQ